MVTHVHVLVRCDVWCGAVHVRAVRPRAHTYPLCVQVYADGSSYVGEYQSGLRHGRGRLHKPDGTEYDGEWRHGKMHGHGSLTRVAAGEAFTYVGEFRDAQRHGRGRLRSSCDGSTYDGEWRANVRHGRGRLTTASVVYEGEWCDGERTGRGRLSVRDGTLLYEGRFWRGYWVSPNWHHLRYWLGFLVARVLSPMCGLVVAAAAFAVGYMMVTAPMTASS